MKRNGSSRGGYSVAVGLLVLTVSIGVADVSLAFIGKTKLFGTELPCAVACGDKGVINPNFLGDAFHRFVTQPSIDDLRDKFKSLGDEFLEKADKRLNETLDKKLKELDTLATTQQDRFFTELDEISRASMSDLDNVLQANIEKAGTTIHDAQAQAEAGLEKATISLNSALVRTAGIAIAIAVIAWGLLKFVGHRSMKSALLTSVSVAALIFVLGNMAAFAYSKWQLADTKRSYQTELKNAVQQSDLYRAAYFAKRLAEFDPFDEAAAAEAAATEIFRDLHHRPTSYRQPSQAEGILRKALNAQGKLLTSTKRRNANLDAVIAMILWQMGDDRYAEYLSARFAAASLTNHEAGASDYGAKQVAAYYLTLFLQSFPSDADLQSIAHQRESAVPNFAGSPLEPPPANVQMMRMLAEKAHTGSLGILPKTKQSLDLNSLNLQSIDLYSRLILAHARAVGASTPADQRKYDNLRIQIALRMESAWATAIQDIEKRPSASLLIMTAETFHESSARASAIRMAAPFLNLSPAGPLGLFENADWHDEIEIPGFGVTRVSRLSELRHPPDVGSGTSPKGLAAPPPALGPPTTDKPTKLRCIEVATAPFVPGIPIAIAGATPIEKLAKEVSRPSMSSSSARIFERAVRVSAYRSQQRLRLLESNLVLSELPPEVSIFKCPSSEVVSFGSPLPARSASPATEAERERRRAGILFLAADLGLLICAEKAETDERCEVGDRLIPLSAFLKSRYDNSNLRYATSERLAVALSGARAKRVSLRF